jgi:DNA-binding transcriptional LysR family regulator
VQLLEGGSRMVEQAVKSGELELGGSLTPSDPAFDYQPFCNEPLDALLPAEHALAGQAKSTWRNWPIRRSCCTSAASCSTTGC